MLLLAMLPITSLSIMALTPTLPVLTGSGALHKMQGPQAMICLTLFVITLSPATGESTAHTSYHLRGIRHQPVKNFAEDFLVDSRLGASTFSDTGNFSGNRSSSFGMTNNLNLDLTHLSHGSETDADFTFLDHQSDRGLGTGSTLLRSPNEANHSETHVDLGYVQADEFSSNYSDKLGKHHLMQIDLAELDPMTKTMLMSLLNNYDHGIALKDDMQKYDGLTVRGELAPQPSGQTHLSGQSKVGAGRPGNGGHNMVKIADTLRSQNFLAADGKQTKDSDIVDELWQHFSKMSTAETLLWMSSSVVICSCWCCMMPGSGGSGNNGRLPPPWGPDMRNYSFREWCRDILIWSLHTDPNIDQSRRAAAIVSQLRGTARTWSHTIPPNVLLNGGPINGVQTDPVTYLMHALAEQFAALGEESRVGTMADLLNFQRLGNENIDELLSRFDLVRTRAAEYGQMALSVQGLSFVLLRAVGVTDTQLLNLLQPFNGNYPDTETRFRALQQGLRRMGHILEHHPGNIAQMLQRGAHSRTFFLDDGAQLNRMPADPWSGGNDPWSQAASQNDTSNYHGTYM